MSLKNLIELYVMSICPENVEYTIFVFVDVLFSILCSF